jgi:pimeloyl-ACP methyl ester carboxylesterase
VKLPPPPLEPWLDRMLPFERYRVEVGGGLHMHVMEQGRGRPVLMLHGNPTWGFLWRKVAARLAGQELRLVMPDLPGLGFSDKPRDPAFHTLEQHASNVGVLIDTLGLEDLIFVAHDWGGAIGLLALADRPALLRGLVLLNTVVGPPRPGFRPSRVHRLAHVPLVSELLFRGLGLAERGMSFVQGDRRSIRGDVARGYRAPLARFADRVAPLALLRIVPDGFDHPSIPALRRAQGLVESWVGPAALVWGDRDPVLGRVRTHLERLLPQAEVTRTNAGHFLQEEVPDQIAAAVLGVARRIDTWAGSYLRV